MCAALFCFSCLDATAKWVNRSVDPMVTVWARYMAAALLTFMVINPRTKPGVLKTRRLPLQLLRSLLLFASTICNFFALKYLQLVETQSIIFATPLLVALFAGPLLGEHIGWRRMAAVAVGFAGVLVITRPGSGTMHSCGAPVRRQHRCLCVLQHRDAHARLERSGRHHDRLFERCRDRHRDAGPPWLWTTPPSPLTWFLLATTGFYGAFGHWLLIHAHARAPAAILSPFIYSQIVWMLVLGYVLFGDWPDAWTFVGAGIVIASGLYLLYRERVKHRKPERPA